MYMYIGDNGVEGGHAFLVALQRVQISLASSLQFPVSVMCKPWNKNRRQAARVSRSQYRNGSTLRYECGMALMPGKK